VPGLGKVRHEKGDAVAWDRLCRPLVVEISDAVEDELGVEAEDASTGILKDAVRPTRILGRPSHVGWQTQEDQDSLPFEDLNI
jgi:hypothetical protein